MMEWHVPPKERCQSLAAILLIMLLHAGPGRIYALDESASAGTVQHKVIPLTHISPERGKEFLTRVKIGTASRLPGTDALLVTAGPAELQKAVAILEIVDTVTEFDIKQFGPVSAAGMMPSNERIADAVGGISIGTFASPPRDRTRMRGIIDVHNGAIVAIAPAFQLKDITTAIEQGPEVLMQRKAAAAPVNPAAVTPTIQATALADSASNKLAEEVRKPQPAQTDNEETKKFSLPREMQQKLDELRQRSAELQAKREAASQLGAQAVPAPTPESPQASGPAPVQPNAGVLEPALPAGLQQVGATPQGQAGPETSPEPAADPAASLRPGEVVPPEAGQVVAPQVEPKPAAVTASPEPAAQVKSPASYYEPAEFPNGDEMIELTLPDKVQVIQLLDLVGKYLGLSYVYDPQKVTGEVTLKLNGNLRGQMKVKDLYLLLESVLQFKDLVMTRHKGNIVKIVPKTEFMNLDPELVGPNTPPVEAGDAVIARVFELEYINSASAENLLQGMGLTIGITPIAESKMLIVTAYAHRMSRIEHLLELVDRPGEPREFKYRQLKYTMAKTLGEKVKALAEQLESVTVTVGEPDIASSITRTPSESDAAYRTRVAQIRAAQAAAARSRALAGAQPAEATKQGVYLDADERTNRILMIGIAKQLDVVDGLVDALDVQQQDLRALQLYRIKHIDAEEMARKLQELGIISRLPENYNYGSSRITGPGRTPGVIPGQPRLPTVPTPESALSPTAEVTEKGLVEEPQVVVVESTNSLLVNATAEQHAKIVNIIEYVDSEMLIDEIPYKIYPLENSSPGHLSEILESLIQETVEQEREGKIEKTVVRREEKIKIVPDPNTYSLIVYGNKKNQEWIASLVKQLDKRRPQVLIDCTLVEVTKSDAFSYDLNVIKRFDGSNATGGDPNGLGKYVEWAGGSLTAFYGDNEIQALLTTMQTKNYGRVLAKPKLLVNDNEAGKIETVDTTYVEVSSAIPVSTGAAGPQNTLVQTSVNFNPYEAGISLDITPHISEGDLLRLDVVLTRSDFLKTPAAGANKQQPPPNTRTNTVDTKVTLPNSSTVILGGLTKMNQTKGGSKVPILGDIPLVGGLFRSIDNEDTQSKLYVFVKAEIIRPETAGHSMKDLEVLSERNRMAFEKHELEFQNYQDWPGVKPKRIDPPKVLDAQ
jgi:general secretion pathway protein D